MRLNTLMKGVAAVAVVAATTVASFSDAEARVRMKVHSAFGKNIVIIGPGPHLVAEAVEKMSDGEVQMKVFEPGALVPGTKYFDPVSTGSIDGAWGTPGYNVHKNFAYAFFSAVPFGPRAGEYIAWLRHGGGIELMDEMYARDNIRSFICNMIPPESSGWFRQEIKSLDDLKGLKMRFFGLGAKVMEKFGVSTQLLAGGDIYPALELGSIDATEFAMPSIDETLGFYQIAKHNYFPGWHQPSSFGELAVNMDKWNALSDWQKKIVDIVCDANIMQEFVDGESQQGAALNRMSKDHGVTLHSWSDDDLALLEEKWIEVATEEAAANPDFKRVWEHYSAYREEQKEWRSRGYLK